MKKSALISLVFCLITSTALTPFVPPLPPPGAIGPYLNQVFPATAPGGSWELEDPLPDMSFMGPLRILPFPNSTDLLVLCKVGEIWRVSLADQTRELILDIKDRSFKKGEAGTVGMALHPRFGDPTAPEQQQIFVFYRSTPTPDSFTENGFNRLSKFSWDESAQTFDPASEEILIQQYDRMSWHNGGAMFFGPDDFLYLSLGDEGDSDHITASTQRLDGGLFSGVIRIDVDNDPSRSHPIRRQPQANANPPAGWGDTFSQGYSIPDDNPWLAEDGSILEEFFAIGIRSPYNMIYDSESGQIWMTDVGSSKREEINIVERGDNLQWPYIEGTLVSEEHDRPAQLIGQEKSVYAEYDRTFGSCIIGGSIYRGTTFPELNGKFLFADWVSDKLMSLSSTSPTTTPDIEVLLSDLSGQAVNIPEKPGVTGIFPLDDGQILIPMMGEDAFAPGKIFRLQKKVTVAEPPTRLSELGVFTDLESLSPAPGIIPYRVNAPLWSDHAAKLRWMAIPNDGHFNSPSEQIDFHSRNDWVFPEGTVFIKHFELAIPDDPTARPVRLETRFFVVGAGGQGYGLTYKWNEEGTDAILLGGGTSREVNVVDNGQTLLSQTWTFPSRDQCLSCHNANAHYILGVKTHQLNGEQFYPDLGQNKNQLEYLSQQGVFRQNIGEVAHLPRAFHIADETADLGVRIRSYLDGNCASCHRSGGVNMVSLDFRFSLPLPLQNMINQPTQSQASALDLVVKPGSHQDSEIWQRDASTTDNQMPPLGRSLVDETYITALATWIDNLPENSGNVEELVLFPNPTGGWVNLRLSDNWQPPFRLRLQSATGENLQQLTTEASALQLDLTAYPASTYFLEISGNGFRVLRKIIVQ